MSNRPGRMWPLIERREEGHVKINKIIMNIDPVESDQSPEKKTPSMRFQKRDGQLLQAIFERDGVMARRQLMELFWSGKSARAMEKRLAKLHQAGYIAWPDQKQRRTRPIPEPIVWLGWKGMGWIAGHSGIRFALPEPKNEAGMRKLEKSLREQGLRWVREPRWAQLEHDLAVVDFRLVVEKAVKQTPSLFLETWISESSFHSKPDVVEYDIQTNGSVKHIHRRVIPDGYFSLVGEKRNDGSSSARSRFLLEIDMATHDNPSFAKEKILPGLTYLLSSAYRQRFGDNSGRWLIVTTGECRMQHLKRQAEAEAREGASAFYFTTLEKIKAETVLFSSIWCRGGDTARHALFGW